MERLKLYPVTLRELHTRIFSQILTKMGKKNDGIVFRREKLQLRSKAEAEECPSEL